VDIHVGVNRNSEDFDLLADEVAEGKGRWGGVPHALLLGGGEVWVSVGGRVGSSNTIAGLVGVHES